MVSFVRVGVVKAITLIRGVNEFVSILATFIIRFGWKSVSELCT